MRISACLNSQNQVLTHPHIPAHSVGLNWSILHSQLYQQNAQHRRLKSACGSVVPLFRKMLKSEQGYFPITHKEMTRFWITLDQGVEMVLSALEYSIGGEILIPKIPSMTVVDLAKAMAPAFEHRFIGIRPGEKMHEVMVPQEDTRTTFELEDRYVILPQYDFGSDRNSTSVYMQKGTAVANDFVYSSDNNTEWLDVGGLRRLLGEGL